MATAAMAPKTKRASACLRSQSSCQNALGMILRTVAARHAKSQIRAASSTGDGFELLEAIDAEKEPTLLPVKERLCSYCTNAHNPMKHSNSQDRPPTLVLTGANAKVSANKANASDGKGRQYNAQCPIRSLI